MDNLRKRSYCFTLNNYTDEEKYYIKISESNKNFLYLIYGKEIGESGTKHLQGWFQLKEGKSIKSLKKIPGFERMSLEERKGSVEQNEKYCRKDGKTFSYGELPNQGKRTDLKNIKERLVKGDNIRDVVLEDCNNLQQLRYAECLQKYLPVKKREKPEVYWFVGPTGVGKSYLAGELAGEEAHWVEPDGEWWDGYWGQENIVWDEFRGQIPLGKLLRLLDCNPLKMKNKGGFTNMAFKKIWITSCKTPEEVYKNCGEDIGQLHRRITEIVIFSRKSLTPMDVKISYREIA